MATSPPFPATAPAAPAWAPVAVAGAFLFAHAPMLRRGWVWDDLESRTDMALRGAWRLFEPDPFGFVRPGKAALLSAMESVWGGWAPGWQLTGMAIGATAAVLVHALARRLGLGPGGALLAGLVYAVHPFHVEATGWSSALNGMLVVVLGVAALLLVLRGGRGPLLGAAAMMMAAMACKEEAIALPVVAGLLVWWRRGWAWRPMAGLAAVLAAQGAMAAGLRVLSRTVGQQLDPLPLAPWVISLHAPWTMLVHGGLAVWPFRWAYYAEPPMGTTISWALAAAGWVALGWLATRLLRRGGAPPPRWAVVVAAGVVAMAPMMNLLPMGNHLLGVRYLAPGMVWGAIGVGMAWEQVAGRRGRMAVLAGLLLWSVAAVVTSWAHHGVWRTHRGLMERMAAASPQGIFQLQVARDALGRGELDRALAVAEAAPEDGPREAFTRRLLLAMAHSRRGDTAAAMRWGQAALELRPEDSDLATVLGDLYEQRYARSADPADLAAADRFYTIGRRGHGENALTSHLNQGLLWVMQGDAARGIAIWEEGLARFPGSAELRTNLAIARRNGRGSVSP